MHQRSLYRPKRKMSEEYWSLQLLKRLLRTVSERRAAHRTRG